MYLSVVSRPDILYALSCLSEFTKTRVATPEKTNYKIEYRKQSSTKGVRCETDGSRDTCSTQNHLVDCLCNEIVISDIGRV